MSQAESGVHVELSVVSTEGSLTLRYVATNGAGSDVYLLNRLVRDPGVDDIFQTDPNLVYVQVLPGPVAHLTKRVPDLPEDTDEEVPIYPCATRLGPGASFEEVVSVPIPVAPFDPYVHRPVAGEPVPSVAVELSLGWIPVEQVSEPLLTTVETNSGRLPFVKISPVAQRLALARLDLRVPVLAPPGAPERWRCANCAAENLGTQAACLRCGTVRGAAAPLPQVGPAAAPPPPPPPPPAPGGWIPTHRTPPDGLAAWAVPDPAQPVQVTLGPGLPLAIAERAGDWARVVASNGWTGWVDARRLLPG